MIRFHCFGYARAVYLRLDSFGYGGANAHCILDHPSVIIPGYQLRGLPVAYEAIPGVLTNSHSDAKPNGNGPTNGHATNGNGVSGTSGPSLYWWKPAKLRQTERAGTGQFILLPVSGHDERAVKANLTAVSESFKNYNIADLLYTLGCRTSTFSRRAFAIADTEAATDELNPDLTTFGKAPSSVAQRIGFVFTGQGAQWPQSTSKSNQPLAS